MQMVGQQKTTNQKVVVGKPVNNMIKLKSILKEKLDNNEYQMVDGIIDILNQVLDVENRKSIADNMVRQFKDEGIKFDYSKFYNAIGCSESMVKEDGFPGGAGVGLSLPGGYINGAPSYDKVKSTKKRIQNDKNQRYTKVEQK
jgi:hypothetical protein